MNILVLNPGGNSLKAELIRCDPRQSHAFEATQLLGIAIEGIGENLRCLDWRKEGNLPRTD
jgi:hypothetical protein